jgi:dTDP-glucose 4,6-dehydratase
MKLVVITGCLGLIGSYLTRKCLEKGWKVLGIDDQTYAANIEFLEEFNKNKNFSFIKEDISKLKFLPDCDYVINLAAESHVENSIINSNDFINTNILGVQNLLNLIKNKSENVAERPIFIQFSTDEVYGDIKSGSHTESDILKPSNPYSASKAAADMLVLGWSRTHSINYIIIRPTNNYGIGQYPEKLIPLTIKLFTRGKKMRLHEKGTPVRVWLHSEDTSNAVIKIIESDVKNEIYNISGDLEQDNKTTIKKIIKHFYGTDKEFEKYVDLSYARKGQDIRYSLNDEKIRKLGWKPNKIFDEEIEKIVFYYKEKFRW